MNVKEITNRDIWEKFILQHAPQSLFQSWNWGEAIKNAKCSAQGGSNVKCLWRLGIFDREILSGIAQVVKVSAKRGTFLHIRHGPVFSSWKMNYWNFLLDYLKPLAREERAKFIRISPLIENSKNNKDLLKSCWFIDAPIHTLDGEYCWVLDLGSDEKTLLANMRKTTRYLIRQAEKLGVKIVSSKDPDDLKDFLTLYDQTAKRHHFVQHTGIREEFTELSKDDQILLFKGYHQKKLLSAALVVFYNNQAIYHHSASIDQKIPVNYLLQWEVIKEAKRREKEIYNFWGVAPLGKPNHPWLGLSLFKKGFGGRLIEYLHAQDLPLSPLYCTTYMIDWFRRIRKGY